MRFPRIATLLAVLAVAALVTPTAEAQNYGQRQYSGPFVDFDEFNPDYQFFAPLDNTHFGDFTPNMGWYFTWDKLLAMEGNTAPYLLFAYARLSAILRKVEQKFDRSAQVKIQEPAERSLSILLCRFPETVESLTKEWRMNALTDYLYSTASSVMKFLETCRVLDPEHPEVQNSRLRLCLEAQNVVRAGLELLGIETVERM